MFDHQLEWDRDGAIHMAVRGILLVKRGHHAARNFDKSSITADQIIAVAPWLEDASAQHARDSIDHAFSTIGDFNAYRRITPNFIQLIQPNENKLQDILDLVDNPPNPTDTPLIAESEKTAQINQDIATDLLWKVIEDSMGEDYVDAIVGHEEEFAHAVLAVPGIGDLVAQVSREGDVLVDSIYNQVNRINENITLRQRHALITAFQEYISQP